MKDVRIIGLTVNRQVGIIKAHTLQFDEKNRLIVFKGGVGDGKTTEQKLLQLSTQGQKTLTDKNLYGEIDSEVQLIDGDVNIWVGCKSHEGKLQYVLYTKDDEGIKLQNPVIDGVKATPAKYLDTLQTELTWHMDKLTSENPTVQRDILLKLYQSEFKKLGVVFDKKSALYKDSILHQIQQAEDDRNVKDALRKQVGGIKDDLVKMGYDPDRPATIPSRVDVSELEAQIQTCHTEMAMAKTNAENDREQQLLKLVNKGAELVNECNNHNAELEKEYQKQLNDYKSELENHDQVGTIYNNILNGFIDLKKLGALTDSDAAMLDRLVADKLIHVEKPEKPTEPRYIKMSDDKKRVLDLDRSQFDGDVAELIGKVYETKLNYSTLNQSSINVNTQTWETKIEELDEKKNHAESINKIVDAVDSFYEWREADEKVKELKQKYVKLLTQIDTGVEGLRIVPEGDDIFLMYDGRWDTAYFNNTNGELRKVSSYSGTQKPVICLLMQHYLLSKKPKAMRYMYIDNVPIDNKTRALLEKMCKDLDLRIFLNITGDFTRDTLKNGEVLIEGGEVFFN